MPSWADLNERQRQYMQAIYETDQEQEADKRGVMLAQSLSDQARQFSPLVTRQGNQNCLCNS